MASSTPEKQSDDEQTGQGHSPSVQFENQPTQENNQTQRSKLLIFLVLSLVTLTQAFDATCICVTLPVSFAPLPHSHQTTSHLQMLTPLRRPSLQSLTRLWQKA